MYSAFFGFGHIKCVLLNYFKVNWIFKYAKNVKQERNIWLQIKVLLWDRDTINMGNVNAISYHYGYNDQFHSCFQIDIIYAHLSSSYDKKILVSYLQWFIFKSKLWIPINWSLFVLSCSILVAKFTQQV